MGPQSAALTGLPGWASQLCTLCSWPRQMQLQSTMRLHSPQKHLVLAQESVTSRRSSITSVPAGCRLQGQLPSSTLQHVQNACVLLIASVQAQPCSVHPDAREGRTSVVQDGFNEARPQARAVLKGGAQHVPEAEGGAVGPHALHDQLSSPCTRELRHSEQHAVRAEQQPHDTELKRHGQQQSS